MLYTNILCVLSINLFNQYYFLRQQNENLPFSNDFSVIKINPTDNVTILSNI